MTRIWTDQGGSIFFWFKPKACFCLIRLDPCHPCAGFEWLRDCTVETGGANRLPPFSEIENGKRTIGKETARKLVTALNVDYRVFL